MGLFAHIFDGEVLDVQAAADRDAYRALYHAEIIAAWDEAGHVFKDVPPDTLHGARDNGDGTYTNPPTPALAPPLAVLTVTDFKKRFTFAEKAALLGSADAGVKVFLDELNTAGVVHLADPETVAGMNYIVSLGLLTPARRAAIMAP